MIYDHQVLKSYAFGDVVVRCAYAHPDTKEMMVYVKVLGGPDAGSLMHLSLAYCNKLVEAA